MFTAYCHEEQATVLLSYKRLRGLANTPLGIELAFDCWCGAHLEVLSGATVAHPLPCG